MAVNGCSEFAVNFAIFRNYVVFFQFNTVIFVQPYPSAVVC